MRASSISASERERYCSRRTGADSSRTSRGNDSPAAGDCPSLDRWASERGQHSRRAAQTTRVVAAGARRVASRLSVLRVAVSLALLIGGFAHAQDKYPTRVIRIVTAAPGSNHDWGARLTANELSSRLTQRVIVENRGSIAVEYVAKDAPPDGYTVLFYGAYVWLQPLLNKVTWDPFTDFAP